MSARTHNKEDIELIRKVLAEHGGKKHATEAVAVAIADAIASAREARQAAANKPAD